MLGTSNYLSPEQAGGQQVTAAADVYSLGVVVYEMLAGDVPFPGGNQVVVALRHATEAPPPLPSSVPPRLAAAVTRALAKDPARRFASMAEFAAELRACLAEPLPPPAPELRVSHRTRRSGLPLVAALLALVAAATVIVVLVLSGRQEGSRAGSSGSGGSTTVTLRGVTGYDPAGTNGEHNAKAPLASDGRLSTFWQTETYASPDFGNLKSGVGLVLDAGTAVKLGSLTVKTNTPGYTARILAGDSPSGPFDDDSTDETVGASTTFALNGATARYYVVWITLLPPGDVAHVNEATAARTRGRDDARGVRARAQSDGRAAPRTGCRTPRTTWRRRSSR